MKKQGIKEPDRAEKASQKTAIRLEALLNSTTDLILMLDLEGCVVTANKQACERYGKTLQKFKGLNIFSLMPPESRESRKKMADTVIRSKQPVCCFEEIEGMFYSSIIYPIFDDMGDVKNYSVFVRDVSPFKLAEKSLKNSEKSFKTLAENANDGIIVIKMDGNIVYTNKCFAKICGYNDLGFLKHSIDNLIEPVERAKIRKILQGKLGENPVPDRFDFKLITKSGRAVPVEATASRTIWQRQPVSMMIVRDVTQQRETEAKLIRKQIRLEYSAKTSAEQLVQTNNALSVLARNIDQSWEEAQKDTDLKIDSKILPLIENLQKNKALANYITEFDLLKAYLNELHSSSIGELSSISTLTNAELRIASMIKNGLKSSEIGQKLCISQETIKTHRRNIRNKLNIRNSKINLASYLRTKLR